MSYASVLLDMPPSANRMWRKGVWGMYPSAEYKAWKTAASMECMATGAKIADPVDVLIIARRIHKGRDLDNVVKPILDALQMGGMLENDRLVEQLLVRWALPFDVQPLAGREIRVEIRTR